MTDLETRLGALRAAPVPEGADPGDLRRRAARRSRHRRTALLAVTLPVLLVAGLLTMSTLTGDDPAEQVRTDPAPATSAPPSTTPTTEAPGPEGTRVLGDVEGVSVEVTPRTHLRDGDLVTVRIQGLDDLPEAKLLLCRGDVSAEDAGAACADAVVQVAGQLPPTPAREEQTISVSRWISDSYDCAVEPAGCVLAVGPYEVPVRAVLVPLTFSTAGTRPQPSAEVDPDDGLADGDTVTLRAEGLRPNGTFVIVTCSDEGGCDETAFPTAVADAEGRLETEVVVRAATYSFRGRTDCTDSSCSVSVRTQEGEVVTGAPITFAPGIEAPVPQLTVVPPGPYVEDQEVTVRGTGFPPGVDVGPELGICPVGLDTAVEERCIRPLAFTSVEVGADGTFVTELQLGFSTLAGHCGIGPECHLGWVLNHGPTVATAPLPTAG